MMQAAGGIAADKVRPEKGGACRCWCSPGYGKGWSLIQKVNTVSVTLLDNWGNGGKDFTRTVRFDQLQGVMSRAEVEAKRAAGQVAMIEGTCRGAGFGFYLLDEPVPPVAVPEPPAAGDTGAAFEAMKATLKAGVTVVTAPHLFPTPPDLARRVVELAEIGAGMRVLEPSAGTGALVRAIQQALEGADVVAVEINATLAAGLADTVQECRCADFLALGDELGESALSATSCI